MKDEIPSCKPMPFISQPSLFVESYIELSDQIIMISTNTKIDKENDIDGLVQDCSNSIANALELLQSYTKPSVYAYTNTMSKLTHRPYVLRFADAISK